MMTLNATIFAAAQKPLGADCQSGTAPPGKPVSIWTFTQTAANRIWLECSYRGTSVTLARPLDLLLKSCEVTYTPGPGGRGIDGVADVQCR